MWNLSGTSVVVHACAEWLMIVLVGSGGARTAFSTDASPAFLIPNHQTQKIPNKDLVPYRD